jgi:hypothetical protein
MARTSLRWTYPSGIAIIPPSGAAPAFVQGATADSGAAEVASLDVTLGVGAAAGNLLVAFGNSDATIATPSGFSVGDSAINNAALYVWWKIAAGGETTVTLTPSVTRPVVGAVLEYSSIAAVSPKDVSVTATGAGPTTGPVSAGTTSATSQASELVVAATGPHSFSSAARPASPTWTNSYTTRASGSTAFVATAGRNAALFVGELIVSSVGAQTTATSWTNSADDWGAIICTFKGA